MTLKKNILITGRPGTGKTTLITSMVQQLADLHPVGFYTREIREAGVRVGFEIVGLDGRTGILAHIRMKSPHRVGKYGVDVPGFEAFLSGLSLPASSPLVILDEIGKMECLSGQFRQWVREVMDAPPILIATIALHGDVFIESLKHREDVHVRVLTRENRNEVVPVLTGEVRSLLAQWMRK